MTEEKLLNTRLFADVAVNEVRKSGLYFHCFEFVKCIKRVEATGHKVVGFLYDGENSIEFLTDPPYEGDEFVVMREVEG